MKLSRRDTMQLSAAAVAALPEVGLLGGCPMARTSLVSGSPSARA